MITWQRIEGALVCLGALVLLTHLGLPFPLWLAFLVFFAPDLSFAAYLFGPRVGAFGYNLVHLYAFGLWVAVLGLTVGGFDIVALGLLWLAHAGFDRALGYGLKSGEAFVITHLGRIGPNRD